MSKDGSNNQGMSISDLYLQLEQIDKNIKVFQTALAKELENKAHYKFIIDYLEKKEQLVE